MGGGNQLWMTKTPANCFVRSVVEIVVSPRTWKRPRLRCVTGEHPSSPNAGVTPGTQAARGRTDDRPMQVNPWASW